MKLISKGKRKKKLETSKKLLYFSIGQFVFISLTAMAACFVLRDITPFIYLIPASCAVISLAIPFYLNKAKAENTQGGIVHDAAMAKLQAEACNYTSEELNTGGGA